MSDITDFEKYEIVTFVLDICSYLALYTQQEQIRKGQPITQVNEFDHAIRSYTKSGITDWSLFLNDLRNSMTEYKFDANWLDKLQGSIGVGRTGIHLQNYCETLRHGMIVLCRFAILQSKLPIPSQTQSYNLTKNMSYALATVYRVYEIEGNKDARNSGMIAKAKALSKVLKLDETVYVPFCENFLTYLDSRKAVIEAILKSRR